MAKWVLKRNKAYTEKIAEAFSISPVTANVIANRHLKTAEEIEKYLYCKKEYLYNAMEMKDMKKGLEIISEAIKSGKKIVVYGDYDADGVMSTVILYKTLSVLGADCMFYLPHRQKEGYGMNTEAVEELHEKGVQVILACDNGIAAINEVAKAKELGMEVVIIDHHEPAFESFADGTKKDIVPCADAVIDCKQEKCPYPFKMLCAAGMSYKFSSLLFEKMGREFTYDDEFITFAAIATVCDVVDMLDENRIIARNGLALAQHSPNIGMQALLRQTNLDGTVNEYHAGFVLGPCINATGRLQSAELSVKLFIEEDEKKAILYAAELAQLNNERKLMTTQAVEEAIRTIEKENLGDDRVLVIYCADVHESIAGIVAGRIKEIFYKPVIMITDSGDMAKGSARSIESYNIFEELFKCRDLFIKFGGHPMAAGLSLEKENIDVLRKRLNAECTLTEDDMTPVIRIESILDFKDITKECAKELETLAPFGKENPSPVFASTKVKCRKVTLMGKNKDMMRMVFTDRNGNSMDGVSFDGFEKFREAMECRYDTETCSMIFKGMPVDIEMDILYNISVNRFNGRETLQLNIKDMRFQWMK